MAAFILTMATSLFISGGLWMWLGSRFSFSADPQQNEALNFAAYFIGSLPLSFVLIFFGVGG